EAICMTPRPMDVATPKSTPTRATMSMMSPQTPLLGDRISGVWGDIIDDVDDVPPNSADPVTEQRLEREADGERELLPVGGIGDGHSDDHVNGPRVQTPV